MASENPYENELIEALADCFCIAAEVLDSQSIICCIQAALDLQVKYHQGQYELFTAVKSSITEV